MKYYFTSESVTEGHLDKTCDYISDTIYIYTFGTSSKSEEELVKLIEGKFDLIPEGLIPSYIRTYINMN